MVLHAALYLCKPCFMCMRLWKPAMCGSDMCASHDMSVKACVAIWVKACVALVNVTACKGWT